MTTISVNTIESSTSTLTIGESGNSVVAADSVNVNLVKDASGATMWQSNGSGVLSNVNSKFGDSIVLLSTQTASSSASINFTSGIDSTYKEYIFKYINIHPATDGSSFSFQCSKDAGSTYNLVTTSSTYRAYHFENDSQHNLAYDNSTDQAEGTGYQWLAENFGSDNDQSGSGTLTLYNPSSTTFAKHYIGRCSRVSSNDNAYDFFVGGYFNDTSAINAISFKMSAGNIDAGTIKMYGVK